MLETCMAPGASATLLAAPAPALIETFGLNYAVQGRRLLRDIDLTIAAGRRTLIVGANGSGKSLLLRLLHGLLTPSAGDIRWRGGPLDRTARRAQAMVFQRPVMLRRSVLANLRFALGVRGIAGPERARREAAAIREARLQDLLDRPARQLSGGEQQRLALARALVGQPDMLFLDEPTASLDPASTKAIEDLILRAHAQGVAIVMVTHDPGQARRLAQDVVFMHAGRVVEHGPSARLLRAPRTAAAQAWLDGQIYLEP